MFSSATVGVVHLAEALEMNKPLRFFRTLSSRVLLCSVFVAHSTAPAAYRAATGRSVTTHLHLAYLLLVIIATGGFDARFESRAPEPTQSIFVLELVGLAV